MPDLISRFSATLDEVERMAQATAPGAGLSWSTDGGSVLDEDGLPIANTARGTDVFVRHMARWDPEAVLRLVAAHRRIIDRHKAIPEDSWSLPNGLMICRECGELDPCPTVVDMASGWGLEVEQ